MKPPRRAAIRPASASSRRAGFSVYALVVCVTALAVRLAHMWLMRRSPFFDVLLGDSGEYDRWARQIAGGDWIGQGVFYQAPLYAYFLGAVYSLHDSLEAARVVQAVLGALSCALLAYAGWRLFDRTVGLVAGLMLAVYAPAVFFDGLIQKSVIDIFFICVLLALLSDAIEGRGRPAGTWRWFGIGLTLGALAETRENALVLAPIVIGWIWLDGVRLKRPWGRPAAIVAAGLTIVLASVGLRNLIVGGEFHLTTTQFGPNLFIGNNARADGSYGPLRAGRGSPEYERLDAEELAERASGRELSPGEVSRYWTRRALDYVRQQPGEWLALEARKLRLLASVTEVVDTESQQTHEDYSIVLRALARFAHFGVLLPLSALGVWIAWPERRRLWLLAALAGGYAATVVLFYVVARYRLPLVPFLVIFAASAVVNIRAFLPQQSRASVLVAAICLLALAAFSNVQTVSADVMRAVTYQNLGAVLQERGALDDAARAYRSALQFKPDYAPSRNGLGSVLHQQGKLDESLAHLEEAVRLQPDFDDARFNLANALSESGRSSEAISRYQDLLSRRPDAVDVHANLGVAFERAERIDEALQQFRRVVRLAPRSAQAHYNLGHTLLTRGDWDEGVEELGRAAALDPADAKSRDELGRAYLGRRRYGDAIDRFREALRIDPRSVSTHNNLGIALGSMGRVDEAIGEFQAAVRLDSRSSEAIANLNAALALRARPK